jgi:hypothetical protein
MPIKWNQKCPSFSFLACWTSRTNQFGMRVQLISVTNTGTGVDIWQRRCFPVIRAAYSGWRFLRLFYKRFYNHSFPILCFYVPSNCRKQPKYVFAARPKYDPSRIISLISTQGERTNSSASVRTTETVVKVRSCFVSGIFMVRIFFVRFRVLRCCNFLRFLWSNIR